eukprot:tig00021257_g19744.t1
MSIDALPDEVLGRILQKLGLRDGWLARGACRRFRRVAEEMGWDSFDLRSGMNMTPGGDLVSSAAPPAVRLEPSDAKVEAYLAVFDDVSSLIERGKLRLSAGASVALRVRLLPLRHASRCACGSPCCPDAQSKDVTPVRSIHQRTAAGICRVVSAIVRASGGSAQPREVTVALGAGWTRVSMRSGHAAFCDVDGTLLRDGYLLGVLRALHPPAGAASGVESLSLGFFGEADSRKDNWWRL